VRQADPRPGRLPYGRGAERMWAGTHRDLVHLGRTRGLADSLTVGYQDKPG